MLYLIWIFSFLIPIIPLVVIDVPWYGILIYTFLAQFLNLGMFVNPIVFIWALILEISRIQDGHFDTLSMVFFIAFGIYAVYYFVSYIYPYLLKRSFKDEAGDKMHTNASESEVSDNKKPTNASTNKAFIFFLVSVVLCLGVFSIYTAINENSNSNVSNQSVSLSATKSLPQPSSTSYKFISCKVADVTLSNPDGSKRQDLLKSFYHENGGKGYGAGKLIHDPIDNSSTIYVLLDDEIIGTIPEENISHVLAITNIPCDVSVYVSSIVSENNKPIYFARIDFDY